MSRGRQSKTTVLIEAARDILDIEYPMTIRQLFYRLVSRHIINNIPTDYKRVSRVLTDARESGEIDWAKIVDRSRPVYQAALWTDLRERFEHVAASYRKDYWQDQPKYVEVWCEKDAVTGSIESITEKYGVPLRVTRGFASTSMKHEVAEMLLRTQQHKPIYIFYLGDHDPSGQEIQRDLEARLHREGVEFIFERLAIHSADIRTFNLPPLRIKTGDSRSAKFRKRHGTDCVELDALPPTELRSRIESAIRGELDTDLWERSIQLEQLERETTERIAKRFKPKVALVSV